MLLGIGIGLVALAVLVAVHWYAWRRVVGDTPRRRSPLRRAGTAVFVAGPVLAVAALLGRQSMPFGLLRVVSWPGFLWLVFLLYLLMALVVGEVVRPLLRRWLRRRTRSVVPAVEPDPDAVPATVPAGTPDRGLTDGRGDDALPAGGTAEGLVAPAQPDAALADGELSRRLFVARLVGGTAAAVAVGTVGLGTYGVLAGPAVRHVRIPLGKLPRSASGFRIAVVSDIHLGPVLGRGFAQRVVDTINGTQPDLIAVVGDLVDGSVADLARSVEPMAQLRARHGTWFVTGNHEYYSGAAPWVEHVQELGMRLLANDRAELPGFDLAGVNDVAGRSTGQGPDFDRALGNRDPARTAVLLAHQPIVIDDAVRHGVDLQLSGHTHGGQVWPGPYVVGLQQPTVAGLARYGDTQLYVTRGAGAWGPPTRVGAPSDITVVELVARDA